MGLASDFASRVSDPYRSASSKLPHVHGGGFTSTSPAVQSWLAQHPDVDLRLVKVQSTIAALEGRHEGALTSFNKARAALDEAKGREATAHHDARELGQAIDPELARRLLRERQAAFAANEEAAARLSVASKDFAASREALNAAVKYIGHLAESGVQVVLVPPAKLPKMPLADVIAAQRRVLADLDIEQAEIVAAPIPLDDAIASIRAKVGGSAPRIHITAQGVDWTPPQVRLNVARRVGDGAVDVDDATALIEWLLGDALGDQLEELVRAKYINVDKTYSADQRRKALAAVAVRRLQAERIEVEAIFAAWEQGDFVPPRRDVIPPVLLGIES